MPTIEHHAEFPCSVEWLWDLLTDPHFAPRLAPPEMKMELVSGSRRPEVGDRIVVTTKVVGPLDRTERVVEVADRLREFTERQTSGSLKSLRHTRRFADRTGPATEGRPAAAVTDIIDFEPPGGVLGLVLSRTLVTKLATHALKHRDGVIARMLDSLPDNAESELREPAE